MFKIFQKLQKNVAMRLQKWNICLVLAVSKFSDLVSKHPLIIKFV